MTLPTLSPAERSGLMRRVRIETPAERALWQSAFARARREHGAAYASDFAWRSVRFERGETRALRPIERQLGLFSEGA